MENSYKIDWLREVGHLYEPSTSESNVSTPDAKYAYMAVGAAAWTTAHYFIVSNMDGPLPFMDYVAAGTAFRAAKMGANVGAIIYDLTHD